MHLTTQINTEHHGECPSDINKQLLIVPVEWPLDKNINSVLNKHMSHCTINTLPVPSGGFRGGRAGRAPP
jgi:hypothetical protein